MICLVKLACMHSKQCAATLKYQTAICHRFSTASGGLSRKRGHYEVLGLNKSASQKEIKAAFFKLSKQTHPDTNPNNPKNHDDFVRLSEAYSVLSKPSTRREYDFGLAASIYHHQQATRDMYGTHTPGSSYSPGSGPSRGFYDSEQQEHVFWDETIFYMRDRKKDKDRFYDEDSFYGIKGIKRKPNSYIVGLCFVIMGIGFVLHMLAYWWSKKQAERMDRRNAINVDHLRQARERARINGTEKQLEIFAATINRGKSPSD